MIEQPFTLGSLANTMQSHNIENKHFRLVLEQVLSCASQEIDADFAEGFFWSDHFTYNQDLVDSFKYMYPDKMEELLLQRKDYGFYNAPYYVLPRHKKNMGLPMNIKLDNIRLSTKKRKKTSSRMASGCKREESSNQSV